MYYRIELNTKMDLIPIPALEFFFGKIHFSFYSYIMAWNSFQLIQNRFSPFLSSLENHFNTIKTAENNYIIITLLHKHAENLTFYRYHHHHHHGHYFYSFVFFLIEMSIPGYNHHYQHIIIIIIIIAIVSFDHK